MPGCLSSDNAAQILVPYIIQQHDNFLGAVSRIDNDPFANHPICVRCGGLYTLLGRPCYSTTLPSGTYVLAKSYDRNAGCDQQLF